MVLAKFSLITFFVLEIQWVLEILWAEDVKRNAMLQ